MLKIIGLQFDEKNMAVIIGVEAPDGQRTGFPIQADDIVRILPVLQEISIRVKDAHARANPGLVFNPAIPVKEFGVSTVSPTSTADGLTLSFISPDKIQGHFHLDERQAKSLADMLRATLAGENPGHGGLH